jgi:CBS domain-containing protein
MGHVQHHRARCRELLVQHRISAMLVDDGDGNLVGTVSEGDLLHRTEIETEKPHCSWWLDLLNSDRDAGDYVKSHGLTVTAVMTHEVVCVADSTPLDEIANILESHHIKRMPVCGKGGSLASSAARISCGCGPRARHTIPYPIMPGIRGHITSSRILLAFDGSKASELALDEIIRIARDGQPHELAVRVLDASTAYSYPSRIEANCAKKGCACTGCLVRKVGEHVDLPRQPGEPVGERRITRADLASLDSGYTFATQPFALGSSKTLRLRPIARR